MYLAHYSSMKIDIPLLLRGIVPRSYCRLILEEDMPQVINTLAPQMVKILATPCKSMTSRFGRRNSENPKGFSRDGAT